MAKQETKGEARQRTIVKLARQALVEAGYDRFSLREIANQAGMRLGNLQYYFPTKEALIEAVVRQEFDDNLGTLSQIAGQDIQADEALRRVALALVSHWLADGAKIYAVMSFLALHEMRFRALRDEIYTSFYAALLPFVKAVQPGLSGAQQKRRVRVITSLLDGALLQGEDAGRADGRASIFMQDISAAVLAVART